MSNKNSENLMATDIQKEELWIFPMNYPIKIIGEAHADLLPTVLGLLRKQFEGFDSQTLTVNPSRTGKYHSIKRHPAI